ncbi:toll-like receptor 13 isoform X4 [Seriola aureovittata]|uniref:toll-like receptor 13 isoform X4 n=1 Tax=Seriola aureovittata TaxID=2871759 RepID=UPI0024BD7352|nr:toll-like receptor 13 isoform X4 [Seriola aureovittata]
MKLVIIRVIQNSSDLAPPQECRVQTVTDFFLILCFHLYFSRCHHITCCAFTFTSGKPIIDNITDAIYGSRKTICVISRRYLESEWCSREIQVASFRLFDEHKDVLIMVFLEDIPTRELSPYYRMRKLLKKRTYLSWPRAEEHTELFWEKLCQALKTRDDRSEDILQLTVGDRP